jgi:cytochrome b subunit of formate dehydrogenase
MSASIQRFSVSRRVEHVVMMSLFVVLSLTGFPQKFFGASLSQTLTEWFGGVGAMRMVHRVSGGLFTALVLWHFGTTAIGLVRRTAALSMVPARKDFSDAITTLSYYLGTTQKQARFDRFDYRQKFEYWGLVFGAVVMVVTGLVLLFPLFAAQLFPGQVIPASKVAHGSEGLMAFLVVIVWHIYNAHLSPDVFPFDTSIFTGRISRERMEKEHPLELERLDAASRPDEAAVSAQTSPGRVASAEAAEAPPARAEPSDAPDGEPRHRE